MLMLEGESKGALEHTIQAETYGRSLELHRIRAEALALRAQIMLRQGDVMGAGVSAAKALSICNRHGMRLRQLSILLIYGEVLFARGRKDLARSLVENVMGSSQAIHYFFESGESK